MSPFPALPLPFTGPFTAAQARAVGISAQALRYRLQAGQIFRLRRGVYAPARELSPRERIDAALLTAPSGAVLAREAAATLLGIPIPHSKGLDRVDLYVAEGTAPGGGRPHPEVRLHYRDLPATQMATFEDIAITTIARTAVDISCSQPLERALIALDHARYRGARLQELYDARYSASGQRGVAILDWALRECSPLAESPFESMSRGVFLCERLPRPVLQQELRGASGRVYRADFFWAAVGLIGEADGFGKYASDPQAFKREKLREDDLRLAGYAFVRWTWDELVREPRTIADRVRSGLNRRRLP